MKATFEIERARVVAAMREFEAEGLHDVSMRVVDGPGDYLFGEESALLEVVEGRQPFPRVTPPYRRGLDEGEPDAGNPSSTVELASEGGTDESPALVDNVETLANVPGIVEHGPAWFRSVGTDESPGTIVCTITGATRRHGVGEFAMGTPLRDVIETLGGGAADERALIAAMSGTANAAIAAPISTRRSPTNTSRDSARDSARPDSSSSTTRPISSLWPTALPASSPSNRAGSACRARTMVWRSPLALDAIRSSSADADAIGDVRRRFATVADGARCSLASQHTMSVASLLALGGTTAQEHVAGQREAAEPYVVAPMVDLVDGQAIVDATFVDKNPDWSYGGADSASVPAELYADTPVAVRMSASAS